MPLSPSATRALLAQLGHRPRQALGQNFLVDGNIVRKSLEFGEIRSGDAVVEVGPGLGTLTSALLEAGAEVWAVEKDRTLLAHLTAELTPRFPQTLHLLEGDAVEHPLAGYGAILNPENGSGELRSNRCEARRAQVASGSPEPFSGFKIVANLPYAIATPWLDAVLSGPLPERMVLMLQREAAQRYAAAPGGKNFGAISIFLQAAYDVHSTHRVAAACFHPEPEVESCLLELRRKPAPEVFAAPARQAIRAVFQRRRKQIGALARQLFPRAAPAWMEQLAAAGYTSQARPESIPTHLWIPLATALQSVA